MKVIEIFDSIDGEGNRAGQLATFIRLAGCNLRCPYCDTKYSWGDSGEEMSVEQILSRVEYRNVTVTGGEPLIHEDIHKLLASLVKSRHNVNVETNGSVDIQLIRQLAGSTPDLYFTVDYKCPSSGQEHFMRPDNFSTKNLTTFDVVKFVVGDVYDLEVAREITQNNLRCFTGDIYISPVFGSIEPSEIVEFMKEYKMEHWNIQVQLHKVIWDPEERGV